MGKKITFCLEHSKLIQRIFGFNLEKKINKFPSECIDGIPL